MKNFRHVMTMLILTLGISNSAFAYTQHDTTRTEPSQRADTIHVLRLTPQPPDSLFGLKPSEVIAAPALKHSASIMKTEDLLQLPLIYLPSLGMAYQPSLIEIGGLAPSHSPVLLEGLPIAYQLRGAGDLRFVPFESLSSISYLTPAEGLYFTMSPNAGVLQLSRLRYNTLKPYSKIYYDQGPYGISTLDGLFTQNITRTTNAMIGLQHGVADGRYNNNRSDGWNLRGMLQHQLSHHILLEISDVWSRFDTQLNGGVDLASTSPDDIYNGLIATVRLPSGSEVAEQNDLRMELYAARDTIQNYLHIALRYATERQSLNNVQTSPSDTTESRSFEIKSRSIDAVVDISNKAGIFSSNTRFEASFYDSPGSTKYLPYRDLHLGAVEKVGVHSSSVHCDAIWRIDYINKRTFLSGAATASFSFLKEMGLLLQAALTNRYPNFTERYWLGKPPSSSTTLYSAEPIPERHADFRFRLAWRPSEQVDFRFTGLHHVIQSTIKIFPAHYSPTQPPFSALYAILNGNKTEITAAASRVTINFLKFLLQAEANMVSYRYEETVEKPVPTINISSSFNYIDTLFAGNFPFRIGVRILYLSAQEGRTYFPDIGYFISIPYVRFGPSTTIDFYAVGKIGSAILHFGILNITDAHTMLTPVYPVLDRTYHFGVNWEFWD
ncbi:MAG: putative porin [Bacteroidota bacterium]